MEQRRFGNSDLVCSAVGFGTWELSTSQYGAIDADEAGKAMHAAIDRGVTLVDTAEAYGPFLCEKIVGKALGARRKDVVLVTKVGFRYGINSRILARDSSPASVIEHTELCLKNLGTDYIDLLLIHWPDINTPIPETIGALQQLKAAGKIRYYGVSNYTVEMMEACEALGPLTTNQVGYNMFDRRMEAAVLPHCLKNKIGFMAYGSLSFGLLSGGFTTDTMFVPWDWRSTGRAFGLPLFDRRTFLKELRVVERLKALAASYGKTVAQMAIAWVLGNPAVTVALVGTRNRRELEEDLGALDWKLTAADRAEIDRIFAEEDVTTHINSPQAVGR
jgi:aryl-alcohol dehydrogenase-like predicted oxidoreductase